MLDTETKRRIDSCRDILVGKVPDPKSQVEQITIALIYKFMDDMDANSELLGGKRQYFAGLYARFGWSQLMAPGMGGQDILNLYSEAIAKMNENPGIPTLFRDIFKNAYLPYRDPETLRAFLKEINSFSYDHSERLGDAFEYLLSVLGAQGDAGQFRTPRHLIDFLVDVIDPQKNETVLDPACGTAGFLISAYKHILANNQKQRPGDTLTPDERTRLVSNFQGYDISPDMVRLSLANLYLHGFPNPSVEEYDTLTSEEHWNDTFDVILANPPFMSPKGGGVIRPHKQFSIQSNRSEVLFVDYIAEHLSPQGRAAIIVPEGIIFQSGTAYRALRKELVRTSLVAVVSLPAGVFQPYSGVKTSVLILDKRLARHAQEVLFVKITNDGFGLGAQRRETIGSELPEAKAKLRAWFHHLRKTAIGPTTSKLDGLHLVEKSRIGENVDWNLSGERYRDGSARITDFELVSLGNKEVFQVDSGGTPSSTEEAYWNGGINWATLADLPQNDFITDITHTKRTISEEGLRNSSAKVLPLNTVIVSTRATIGRIGIARVPLATNQGFKNISIVDEARAIPEFVALMMTQLVPQMEAMATGGTFKEISKSALCTLEIPLPPLVVQQEIVAEITGYQRVINGAKQVLTAYQPRIAVQPEWPVVELGEYYATSSGGTPSKAEAAFWSGSIPWVSPKDMKSDFLVDTEDHVSNEAVASSATRLVPANTLLCVVRSSILKHALPLALTTKDMCFNQDITAFKPKKEGLDVEFLFYFMKSESENILRRAIKPGVTVESVQSGFFKEYQLPLPDLTIQRQLVAEIEAEQRLVAANRELIERMDTRIQSAIGRVWGAAVQQVESVS
ncbi:N-6 DNA methylase [Hymenobacter negativus]|uniref:site-specific DNA-methyltransferase (adenine-specific) n=1 Tax=Hymenobacter negativus TaxID=2795026 RepID=A0ABS0Q990_9BACT|nr:N-6 DNA methylase [Hymenobacter negativus]MBH8559246.1 N-6 DNA methylase [Hymenobacter negativus]